MIIVPIENTLLYVQPIYQVLLNESQVPILKKVVVASGNKLAIGNSLQEAIERLVSQDASRIEIENTDDEEGLIEAIIKANNNLSESSANNDWELMGKDINRLQSLITQLEELMKETENTENNESNSNIINETNTIDNAIENQI